MSGPTRQSKYSLLTDSPSDGGDIYGPETAIIQPSKSRLGLATLILALISVVNAGCIWWIVVQSRTTMLTGAFGLSTDTLLGEIPWKPRVTYSDDRFINSDPYDGKAWTGNSYDPKNTTTPWDSLYPSNWVAVSDPSKVGYQGGLDMKKHAVNSSDFEEKSQGFGLAIMHQIHCVGILKHGIVEFERSGQTSVKSFHFHHCIEVLRQAVLCTGDLALELPKDEDKGGVDAWGNLHMCRDETILMEQIRKHAIVQHKSGWARKSERNVNE